MCNCNILHYVVRVFIVGFTPFNLKERQSVREREENCWKMSIVFYTATCCKYIFSSSFILHMYCNKADEEREREWMREKIIFSRFFVSLCIIFNNRIISFICFFFFSFSCVSMEHNVFMYTQHTLNTLTLHTFYY